MSYQLEWPIKVELLFIVIFGTQTDARFPSNRRDIDQHFTYNRGESCYDACQSVPTSLPLQRKDSNAMPFHGHQGLIQYGNRLLPFQVTSLTPGWEEAL